MKNKQITNKEAHTVAVELGFKKTNYRSQGRPVYGKKDLYITPDNTRHIGGFWKMAKSVKDLKTKDSRLGTYDRNLIKIGD